jgi:hypothetical protein
MIIHLSEREHKVLFQLVDQAIREMGPEIRHTATRSYKDDLKEHRRVLQALHDRLASARAEESPPAAE